MSEQTRIDSEGKLVKCTTFLGGTKWLPAEALHFRPSAYAVIIHEGKLLVVTRRRTGNFFLPGGGVEKGESITLTLQREVREETGINISVGNLLDFAEDFYYYDPDDVGFHALLFFFTCIPLSFDLLDDAQVQDAVDGNPRWVDIDGLNASDFQSRGESILVMVEKLRS